MQLHNNNKNNNNNNDNDNDNDNNDNNNNNNNGNHKTLHDIIVKDISIDFIISCDHQCDVADPINNILCQIACLSSPLRSLNDRQCINEGSSENCQCQSSAGSCIWFTMTSDIVPGTGTLSSPREVGLACRCLISFLVRAHANKTGLQVIRIISEIIIKI
jgi:hypothetical protein